MQLELCHKLRITDGRLSQAEHFQSSRRWQAQQELFEALLDGFSDNELLVVSNAHNF